MSFIFDKIANPMEILDREMNNLLDDSDPDLHFYNEIYQKSIHIYSPKPGYDMINVIYMVYRDTQYVKSIEIMLLVVELPYMLEPT